MLQALQNLSDTIAAIVIGGIMAVAGFLNGAQPAIAPAPNLGATIPGVVALFETSLAGNITSTATTMTLVSGDDKEGNEVSGSHGFVVDEGTTTEEFVICSADGTALSSCLRGISVVDGQTEVTALQKAHRRGATVKITNFPLLGVVYGLLNGDFTFPNKLKYDGLPDFTGAAASTSLVSRDYVDNVASSGAGNADTTSAGLVEEATVAEIEAGTGAGGTLARLFVNPAKLLTSKLWKILNLGNIASDTGEIAFYGGSNWTTLTGGTSGTFLLSNGENASPSYEFVNRVAVNTSTFVIENTGIKTNLWAASVSANFLGTAGRTIEFDTYFSGFSIKTASATAIIRLEYDSSTVATCTLTAYQSLNATLSGKISGVLISTGASAQTGVVHFNAGGDGIVTQNSATTSSAKQVSTACVSTATESTTTGKTIRLTIQFSESDGDTQIVHHATIIKKSY